MPLSFLTGLADSNSVPGLEWLDDVPKLPFQQVTKGRTSCLQRKSARLPVAHPMLLF